MVGDSTAHALGIILGFLSILEVAASDTVYRRRPGPYKSVEDVEYATMEWVDWFKWNGLSLAITSVLHNPIVLKARALSYACSTP